MLTAAVRCLKRLVPRATILVAPTSPPPDPAVDVVTVDAEEIAAGPLSAASALRRHLATSIRGPRSRSR